MNIIHPIRRRPLDRAALDWPALENLVALGNISGAVSLNLATDGGARAFIGTLIGNATLAPQNIPVAGLVVITVVLVQDAAGGRAVTLPANTTLLEGSNGSLNPAANSANIVTLITRDGGATWLATISEGRPRQTVEAGLSSLMVSNWATRTSAADNQWVSVTWSPERGLFVAVADTGTGNRVMTSPDGITWTIRSSAADNDWVSVTWSPERGLFVAVAITGTGNQVMTSPDGITWTIRTSAADNQWRSVTWSPELGLFVAVAWSGTGNRVMTSLALP